MSSKLINQQSEMFSNMVVDAVSLLDELMPLNMIGIKKVQGGSLQETRLVEGVAFKKTFSYAGFEMQQKNIQNPKVPFMHYVNTNDSTKLNLISKFLTKTGFFLSKQKKVFFQHYILTNFHAVVWFF